MKIITYKLHSGKYSLKSFASGLSALGRMAYLNGLEAAIVRNAPLYSGIDRFNNRSEAEAISKLLARGIKS